MASEQAIVAGGCFWCTEAVFRQLDGVQDVESGYIGGNVANPTYKQVCSGTTDHAEAIRVTYDPARIGYADLLDVFFATHDPTQLNRQGVITSYSIHYTKLYEWPFWPTRSQRPNRTGMSYNFV